MNISTNILSRTHNPVSVTSTSYMTNQGLPQECKDDSVHTLTRARETVHVFCVPVQMNMHRLVNTHTRTHTLTITQYLNNTKEKIHAHLQTTRTLKTTFYD